MACGPKLEGLPGWARWVGEWMVPDLIFGPACLAHDIAYEAGGSEEDRRRADDSFLAAMLSAAAGRPWYSRWLWRRLAHVYHEAVNRYGRFAFAYRAKEE